MVRLAIDEEITPAEAVASKILSPTEEPFVSSVAMIGEGGYGDIFKVTLKKSLAHLEDHHWKNPVLARNVLSCCEHR